MQNVDVTKPSFKNVMALYQGVYFQKRAVVPSSVPQLHHDDCDGADAGRVRAAAAGARLRHQARRAVSRLHRGPHRPHQGARPQAVPRDAHQHDRGLRQRTTRQLAQI